jgi:hypothetical protein
MVSMSVRGWAVLDESKELSQAQMDRCTVLMQEWSKIKHDAEQDDFTAAWRAERGEFPEPCDNCDQCEANNPEACEFLAGIDEANRLRQAGQILRMELIEAELESLGARPMRPYEHHNEDERYMQYMEEGRFGEYSR